MYNFENPVDTRNRDIIRDIVISHFGLDKESEEDFINLLYDPDIDNVYTNHLGPDLRARFPINKEALEEYDVAWLDFRDMFYTYVKEFNVTYKDFMRGRISVDRNELRIFKHLVSYYLETERSMTALLYDLAIPRHMRSITSAREILHTRINDIISKKLPSKSSFQVVISCNFADWFLCSTGEDWTSCLNLESDYHACYWSGLPGFVKDKNRAMVYITDGRKKEYKGITVDKILSRSFTMLSDKDYIHFLRWYPSSSYFESGVFNNLPFEVRHIHQMHFGEKIKYRVKPLFFRNGYSCFAYQDKTAFLYEDGREANQEQELRIVDKGGQFYLNKFNGNDFIEGGVFSYTNGLSGLISSDAAITDFVGNKCDRCGVTTDEDYSFTSNDGGNYCEDCYNSLFAYCVSCDQECNRDDAIDTSYGTYCRDCHEEEFEYCSDCGRSIHIDQTIGTFDDPEQGLYYCYYCSNNRNARAAST